MTIKKRLARSNIAMVLISVFAAAVLVLLGLGAALLLLRGNLMTLHDAAEQEGLAVTVDVPDMTVQADRELLRRIAVNLLDNSRKYGGRADIRVRITAEKTGGMAAVALTDNGAGVPPEQLPRLFDVFYRGDAARTTPGSGSGLGLAVVSGAQRLSGDHLPGRRFRPVRGAGAAL